MIESRSTSTFRCASARQAGGRANKFSRYMPMTSRTSNRPAQASLRLISRPHPTRQFHLGDSNNVAPIGDGVLAIHSRVVE